MVLLTVIAVGLLTLSSVAMRGTTHDAAMATARANARLALMMAIGELQKQAGPDQRVTATADIAGTATGDPLGPGTAPLNNTTVNSTNKGLSMVQPGTRYWTGVWNQTAATTQIYTKTPSPVLRGWMISGNGGLAPANRLTPASQVAAVNGSGSVSDSTKAVVLVGRTSAGTDSNRYVGAPMVDMADSKGGKPSGRHAWWVGDEGVKAKFYSTLTDNPSGVMTYETMGDRRAGWEAIDGFGNYPTPGSGTAATVAKVITMPEGSLLDPNFGPIAAGSDSALQRNFHSATADGFGLLVDNYNGGLRTDMTPYIRDGFPDSTGTSPIVPRTIAPRMRAPTWNRIKEFADSYKGMQEGVIEVKPAATDLAVAIAPVISELRFLFGVKAVAVQGAPDSFRLHPCVKVAVTLANPYPYPLKWNSGLDLEITNSQPSGTQGVSGGYQPASIYDAAQGSTGRPAYVPSTPAQPAAFNNVIFRIGSDSIPPGEAKAFTIGSAVFRSAGSTSRTVVDMKPFGSANASNFDICMEQGHDAANDFSGGKSLSMDMRESWTTTQITAELRSGTGSNSLLRRIERFELDNAYYSTTKRPIDAAKAREMNNRPFGIHYFRFQLSQPGADYRTILPNPSGVDPLGLRSSTLRTFADFNPQAKRFHKAITSYNPAPYFMQSVDNLGDIPYTGGATGPAFTRDMAVTPLAWGRSSFDTKKVILFSPQEKFVSLAQLQHADLTGDDTFASVGHQPGNAVGNSYATPFVKRSLTIQSRNNFTLIGADNASAFQTLAMNYYDLSYLLNASLWDNYYFSAMTPQGVPENASLVKINSSVNSADLRNPKLAAQHLVIDGAFNVNSTRKEAWKAIFAGSKHLKHKADTAGNSADALYPRSLDQKSPSTTPPTGEKEDSFSGFRRLTDAQLDALAEEMTRQVRMRGPFVSLSQFVNRAIVDINRDKVLGRAGAIQVALDECGANINNAGTKNIFSDVTVAEDKLNLQANGSAPRGDLDGPRSYSYTETNPSEPVWATTSKDLNPGAMASILADRPMLTNPRFRTEQGWRSTGIPGWITQADILQVIGPALSTRSDTFRIRAYGEATDPQTGQPSARAWCEAIVQRMPEYVDQADATADTPGELGSPVNKTFGRRFVAVSFKWLSKDEI